MNRTIAHALVLLALFALLIPGLPAFATERYIIPIWAQQLRGASEWTSRLVVTNPANEPITISVPRLFPLTGDRCPAPCTAGTAVVTLAGKASTPFGPPLNSQGHSMTAGAFEIEASGPVVIDHVVFSLTGPALRQQVDEGRRWVPAGRDFVLAEPPVDSWRVNAFIVNPNADVLIVSLWIGSREENEIRVAVPPGSTSVVSISPPRCDGDPCGTLPDFPPRHLRVELEGNAPFFASVSTVGETWASTALPISAQ